MKILKQGATEIYDYTCEEIKQHTCYICKAVYEYTDSDCEMTTVDNPNYEREYQQWRNDAQNYSPYGVLYYHSLQPIRGMTAKTLTCPCCGHSETFDFTKLY